MFRRKPRPEWEQRLRDIDKELERPINEDWHLGKKDDAHIARGGRFERVDKIRRERECLGQGIRQLTDERNRRLLEHRGLAIKAKLG